LAQGHDGESQTAGPALISSAPAIALDERRLAAQQRTLDLLDRTKGRGPIGEKQREPSAEHRSATAT